MNAYILSNSMCENVYSLSFTWFFYVAKHQTLLQQTGVNWKMNIFSIRRSTDLCASLQKRVLFDSSRAVCCVLSVWRYPWPVFWPDEAVWSRGFSCQHTLPLPRGLCRQGILQYWGKDAETIIHPLLLLFFLSVVLSVFSILSLGFYVQF